MPNSNRKATGGFAASAAHTERFRRAVAARRGSPNGCTTHFVRIDPPAWRKAVQAAARKAAMRDPYDSHADCSPAFNYRWGHVEAVVCLTIRLAELTGADRQVVEAAAWLHDIAKARSQDHGRDGAIAARYILAQTDFPSHKIDAVADAIAKHVWLDQPEPVEPLEAAVLWDADKLNKLGATTVLHLVGLLLTKGERPTVQLLERLADIDWQEDVVRSLHTAPARAAGQQRLKAFRAFCQQVAAEVDGGDLI